MNYPKAQGSTLNWFRRKGRLKIVVKGAILRRHIGFADAKTGQRNQRSCALCGNSPHLSRVHPHKHADTIGLHFSSAGKFLFTAFYIVYRKQTLEIIDIYGLFSENVFQQQFCRSNWPACRKGKNSGVRK